METLGTLILVAIALILVLDPILEKWNNIDIIRDDRKWILIFLGLFALVLIFNPFTRTVAGYRTFVETVTGDEKIFFQPGYHYAGFFSITTDYPDVITTVFSMKEHDNVTAWEPPFTIRFNDATKATAQATQSVQESVKACKELIDTL